MNHLRRRLRTVGISVNNNNNSAVSHSGGVIDAMSLTSRHWSVFTAGQYGVSLALDNVSLTLALVSRSAVKM